MNDTKAFEAFIRAVAVLVVMAACAWQAPARAQTCSFSMPSIDFGDIDLTLGTRFDLTANLSITCSGTPNRRIRTCANFEGGSGGHANGDPRYMLNGTAQLNYNIYRNNGFSQVWGSAFWPYSNPPRIRVQLNGAGTYSGTEPVRVRIAAGQTTLPLGLYSSTFAGSHAVFTYAYAAGGQSCASIGTSNAVQVPFTVQANNIGSCAIVASNLGFGTLSSLTANADAVTTVSVTCASGTSYQIALGGGLSGAGDPTQRRMTVGASQIIYGLYQDAARTAPWGDTLGANTVAGTGTGAAQPFTVFGRIPPQATPPAGTYSDTIVVTLTY